MNWSQRICPGCEVDDLSQMAHMGLNGCLNNSDAGWVKELRSSIIADSIKTPIISVRQLIPQEMESDVVWGIELPSLKRIQVVRGKYGGRFVEIRQYEKNENGMHVGMRNKFIRLSKVCDILMCEENIFIIFQ